MNDIGEDHESVSTILRVAAGYMEAFFREVTKANAMPPQNPELWRMYGMDLLGHR